MKYKRSAVLLAAIIGLGLQAQEKMPMDTGDAGQSGNYLVPGEEQKQANPADALPTDPEARAEALRLSGKCPEAIPILRPLANRGAGYAIAQFHLGLCLFDVSKKDPDPEHAAKLKHEAAEWILQSANTGFPNAQFSLVIMYLDGYGTKADPVEAGKWSLIYHDNSMRDAIGLPDISEELQARLDKVLNEKSWAEAQSRADNWSPESQN